MGFGGFNLSYFIFVIPALILGMIAQSKLQSTYAKYGRMPSTRGMTGRDIARFILDHNGLQHVTIEPINGQLTDHYDPSTGVVRLSEGVYNVPSIAAAGIAAHECGHAVQHSVGYGPLKLRNAIIPITNIGSKLAIPLILIGMLFSLAGLIKIGIFAYALMAIFQLITLPVEFNASARALQTIETNNLLAGDELVGAKATLSAAAMTYVAALLASVGQLLYFISMVGGGRRRK